MKELMTFGGQPLTMSSREIADLVDARHNDVVATIDRLFAKGLLRSSRKTRREETGGRPIDVYDLTERDTHLVVSGYSDEHRARVIDRWQELEAQQTQAFAIPKSLPEALRLAADLSEQNERLALERDTAVRTKAEIGSRREATAMATAAAKAKEVARLKHELGRSQQHATVIAVEKATGRKFAKNAYVALRRATKEYGLAAVEVVDARYGSVKAWPAIAWREAYAVELADIFPSAEAA
ncbi:Rha family transcriptional regulator [Comamonas aquatica]|uniref:Rha family transcriptional regulator n=1 Tax=Comamonas aquatica TaxID=225991 RepID=UPI0034D3FF0D